MGVRDQRLPVVKDEKLKVDPRGTTTKRATHEERNQPCARWCEGGSGGTWGEQEKLRLGGVWWCLVWRINTLADSKHGTCMGILLEFRADDRSRPLEKGEALAGEQKESSSSGEMVHP